MGGKVFHLHRGKYEKTAIADQTRKVCSAGSLRPSNVLISASKRPCPRTKGQGSKIPVNGTLHNVSDLSPTQWSASKVMVSIQKRKPYLGLFAISTTHRFNTDFTQLIQIAMYFRKMQVNFDLGRSLKTKSFFLKRQIQNTSAVQLCQCFTTAHVLKPAIGGTPIQPLADPPGQFQSGNGRLHADCLLDPIADGFGKMLTANIHEPNLTHNTHCVKCVQRSALQGERDLVVVGQPLNHDWP